MNKDGGRSVERIAGKAKSNLIQKPKNNSQLKKNFFLSEKLIKKHFEYMNKRIFKNILKLTNKFLIFSN